MSAGDRVSRILGSTAVQGAIAALPAALSTTGDPQLVLAGLGISVVNASLIAHISGRVEDNRDRLAAETESRLDRLEEQQQFDEQVLESPDFHALVFQSAVAAAQESEDEKIDWYAAILAGAASRGRPDDLNAKALVSMMTFLTADELRLAVGFYDEFEQGKYSIIDGAPAPAWGPDTTLYLRRLETANLIVPHFVAGLPGGLQGPAGNYFVTDTFRRLIALVRETQPTYGRASTR